MAKRRSETPGVGNLIFVGFITWILTSMAIGFVMGAVRAALLAGSPLNPLRLDLARINAMSAEEVAEELKKLMDYESIVRVVGLATAVAVVVLGWWILKSPGNYRQASARGQRQRRVAFIVLMIRSILSVVTDSVSIALLQVAKGIVDASTAQLAVNEMNRQAQLPTGFGYWLRLYGPDVYRSPISPPQGGS